MNNSDFLNHITDVAVQLIKEGKATHEDCIEKAIMYNIDFCAEMIDGETHRSKDYKSYLCEKIYSNLKN